MPKAAGLSLSISKSDKMTWGPWAFFLGVLVSLIVGVFTSSLGTSLPLVLGVLSLLGIIVGILNIQDQEVDRFLIASIALLATSAGFGPVLNLIGQSVPYVRDSLAGFLGALVAFVAPAAAIVALLAVYRMSSTAENTL